MGRSNYPPGVTGNEPQIVGSPDFDFCRECSRPNGAYSEDDNYELHYNDEFCSPWCETKFTAKETRREQWWEKGEYIDLHTRAMALWAFQVDPGDYWWDAIMYELGWDAEIRN
jgi:hypothetical protein